MRILFYLITSVCCKWEAETGHEYSKLWCQAGEWSKGLIFMLCSSGTEFKGTVEKDSANLYFSLVSSGEVAKHIRFQMQPEQADQSCSVCLCNAIALEHATKLTGQSDSTEECRLVLKLRHKTLNWSLQNPKFKNASNARNNEEIKKHKTVCLTSALQKVNKTHLY